MSLNDMMALTVATGAFLLVAGRADAQSVCAEHENLVKQLGTAYGESRQSLGLSTNGSVIEIFASEAGTWTIIITDVNGMACMAAAGESWQTVPQPKPGEGA